MNHIRKEFPGIVANDDVTISVKKGEKGTACYGVVKEKP